MNTTKFEKNAKAYKAFLRLRKDIFTPPQQCVCLRRLVCLKVVFVELLQGYVVQPAESVLPRTRPSLPP